MPQENAEAQGVLEQHRVFTKSPGARRRDKVRLQHVQYSFARQPRDPAGEVQAQSDHRQDHVQGPAHSGLAQPKSYPGPVCSLGQPFQVRSAA